MAQSKRVLVVGSGGREHALVQAFLRSPSQPEVFCAPGNGGIARETRTVDVAPDTEEGIDRLLDFARSESIDLTVVGPEAPLVLGLVDRFEAAGLRAFGPPAAGARLEGSKCFAKEFLRRHDIPTAEFRIFDDAESARAHVRERPAPMVIKADGLAAGKGVIVAQDRDEALAAVDAMLVERRFGDAGRRIVIEDCLLGSEVSIFVVTDGTHYVPLETARDYKPAFDGDEGPNTGGMGAYSPYLSLGDPRVQEALRRAIRPALDGLRAEGIPFRGVLYVGLMLTQGGPRVLEYNVRLGDPETQPVLARLRTDLLELVEAALEPGGLEGFTLEWDARPAVCVVAASGGYPGPYETGFPVEGLDDAAAGAPAHELLVHHAGTRTEDGRIVTAGGRVLGVTALAGSLEDARRKAYGAVERIRFQGMSYRSDIARI